MRNRRAWPAPHLRECTVELATILGHVSRNSWCDAGAANASSGCLVGCGEDATYVRFGEELGWGEVTPALTLAEVVHGVLVAVYGSEKLLQLGGGGSSVASW